MQLVNNNNDNEIYILLTISDDDGYPLLYGVVVEVTE